jgi:tripartite-type tricarboxylate transporter receptor subunit TctC
MWSHWKRLKTFVCVTLALLAQPVLAQNYPGKAIRFIVGFARGGPNDIVARIVSQKLTESFGVPVTMDNRPGAISMSGTQY